MSRDRGWLSHVAAATFFFSTALPVSAAAQAVRFIAHRDYTAGFGPVSVAVGDFNGDRVQDLALAIYYDGAVSVLLGNGDGTFQPPRAVSLGAAAYSRSVAIGDFNRDGKPDLAVANSGANSVSVLLGNGDGTFQPAPNLAVNTGPVAATVGDFNSDGRPDLAVANWGSNTVSVLLGNGDGTFQTALTLASESGPAFVAVGNFNQDGGLDLAVANSVSGTVSIFLGNGNGAFQTARTLGAGSGVWSLAVGDLDGDGRHDLATANNDSNTISVLMGNGDGTFQTEMPYGAGPGPGSIALGDFNGDGQRDLAVANAGSSTLSVLFGNSDGTFQAAESVPIGSACWSVGTDDFNGDGVQDLAAANTSSTTVSVLLGRGDGTFPAAPMFAVGSKPQAVSVADLNLDGRLDLAVANVASDTVSVLLGNGDGTFLAARDFAAGKGPTAIVVGDFNGDGKPDLVASNYGSSNHQSTSVATTVSVLLGNGDGTFQEAQPFEAGEGPNAVAVGDFNSDGVQDLAVADYGPGPPAPRATTVSVLLGNGDGTFGAPQAFGAGSGPTSVAVGDFNRDGAQDLAVSNFDDGSVSVLLGSGDGTFWAAPTLAVGRSPVGVAVGNFNGDLVPDLAVANHFSDTVSVLLGSGDGTFQPSLYFESGSNPLFVAVSDVNADGAQDLALANWFSTTVSVLRGNGDGTFQARADFGVGTAPAGLAPGDFNGDGKPDLAAANYLASTVSILINSTEPAYSLTVSKTGTGGGTVTSSSSPASPAQIDCGTTCSASYDRGTVVTLTAQADTATTFSGWSGCDTVSDAICTVTMSAARLVTVTFDRQRFILTVSKTGTGGGAVTSSSSPASQTQIDCGTICSASYDSGTVVTLTAQADAASTFYSWSGCDIVSGAICTVTMSAARSVTATSELAQVLWSADHETGDLSQWYAGDGGGEFNSGAASATVSPDVAHRGRYSAKGSIITPGISGVRLFRWNESRANPAAYYSAWFYVPENYVSATWWNIFEFKSRNDTSSNDPFWFLQIGNRPGGTMCLNLTWWNELRVEGPQQGQFGRQTFTQTLKDLPVGQWTHIEVFLRQSSAFDGQIIVWQDGVELFNVNNVRTRYPASNGANEWAVTNYSDAINPSPTTIYIDDAVISTVQMGPS